MKLILTYILLCLIFQINLYNLKITDISLYKNNNVYIIEEPFYMLNKSYNYHKLKLVYHRATMKSYSEAKKEKEENKITSNIINKKSPLC